MKFSDSKGREWDVSINIGTVMRLRSSGTNILELEADKGKKLIKVYEDDIELVQWVWQIVKSDAEKAGVTEDEFYSGIKGLSLEAAREAFLGEYSDFTRSPAIRSLLKEMNEISRKIAEKTERAVAKVVEFARDAMKTQSSQISDENILRMCNDAMQQNQNVK